MCIDFMWFPLCTLAPGDWPGLEMPMTGTAESIHVELRIDNIDSECSKSCGIRSKLDELIELMESWFLMR